MHSKYVWEIINQCSGSIGFCNYQYKGIADVYKAAAAAGDYDDHNCQFCLIMTMMMAKIMRIARMMMVHIVWPGDDDDSDYDNNDGKNGDDDDDGIHCVGGGDREEGCCVTGRYPEGPTPTQRRPMIFIRYSSGPKHTKIYSSGNLRQQQNWY